MEEAEWGKPGRLSPLGVSRLMMEEAPSARTSSSDRSMNEVGDVGPVWAA